VKFQDKGVFAMFDETSGSDVISNGPFSTPNIDDKKRTKKKDKKEQNEKKGK
jgi:hypothetical protein